MYGAMDCIHLHACRRMAAIFKRERGRFINRGCDYDCNCYQTAKRVTAVDIDSACSVAYNAACMTAEGYSTDDAVCRYDFPIFEAYAIENGDACTDDGLNAADA